jgi:hypothetical protein
MLAILHSLGTFIVDLFKSRCRLEAENLFLRHQLSIAFSGLSFYVWSLPWLSPSETSYSWRTGADRVMLLHQYCKVCFFGTHSQLK